MNWLLFALVISTILNVAWIFLGYFMQSRIDALAGEVERLSGVKSEDAGA